MADRKLKVGIAGLRRGMSLYHHFCKIPQVEITAVADPDRQKLERVQTTYGIKHACTSYDELLDSGIDAVVVASPMPFHAQQSIQALNRNIHVLSEVTAALTIEECKSLLKAVHESKAKYMLAENACYYRENMIIHNMVKEGLFGTLYYAESEYVHRIPELHYDADGQPTWRRTYQVGTRGSTYGTHSLGPLLQWFDESVKVVHCLGSGSHTVPDYETDDSTLMLCQTQSGGLIKIRTDMISKRPYSTRYYQLQGTKGCYEAPKASGEEHKVWVEGDADDPNQWMPLSHYADDFLPKEWKGISEEAFSHAGADEVMVRDFVGSILEDKPPRIDIYDALSFTLPGILSSESIHQGGVPVLMPDVQEWK